MFPDKNNAENNTNSLFEGVNIEPLKQYFNQKNTVMKKEGDVIYQKGDPTEYMYLILNGDVKLKLTEHDGTNIYILKNRNNFFGETELLAKTSRKSSAVADSGCMLLALNLTDLKALIKADGKILQNLYSNKTFEMSDDDFTESTKHFINFDEFSKTTEKITIDPTKEIDDDIQFAGLVEDDDIISDDKTFESTEVVDHLSEVVEEEKIQEENIIESVNEKTTEDNAETGEDDSENSISFSKILDDDENNESNQSQDIVQPEEEVKEKINVDEKPLQDSTLILDDDSIIIDETPSSFTIDDENKKSISEEPEIPLREESENIEEEESTPTFDEIGFSDTTIESVPEKQVKETYTTENVDDNITDEEKTPSFDEIGFSDTTIESVPEEPVKETYISDYVEDNIAEKEENQSIQLPGYFIRVKETIVKIFSKTSLDETSDIIAVAACELLNAGGGVLYLLNREHNELNAKVLVDNSIESIRLKTDDCLQGTSVMEKRNIIVNDPADEEKFNNPLAAIKGLKSNNAVYFPILSKNNEVKALLELFNSEKGSFTSKDIELLELISPAILQAIQNSQLVEINQNQNNISSIGKISNFLAEDLKYPLLIIKHYAESLKKKDIPDDVKKILDLQLKEIYAGEDFLKSTLSFVHKKNILEMKSVSLSESLNEVIDLLAEYVESRNSVIFKKLEADATVNLDIRQFFLACYQIVKNACDTMPDEGKIYITTEMDEDYIKVKIKDDGIGIPESRKAEIFNPFTTWGKKQHAGLGLAIAEKIISDHGGYIMLDSVVGNGATFIIALPVIF